MAGLPFRTATTNRRTAAANPSRYPCQRQSDHAPSPDWHTPILYRHHRWAHLTSYALQYGVPISELTSKLRNTRFEPSGPTSNKQIPIATSIVDYVFRWLELKFDGGNTAVQPTLIPADQVAESTNPSVAASKHSDAVASGVGCPDCGAVLYYAEGCLICHNCFYNKCG